MATRDEDALRTLGLTTARWNAILETAQDAIICITGDGEVTLFNKCAERMFGYAAEEVIGRNVRMLMPTPYRDEHDGYLERYRQTGDPKAIGRVRQVKAQRKSGEVFPIELSVSEARVRDEVLFNAIIRDVTERERAAAERVELTRHVAQRQRLADIGAVTARIVHDFGNPLAGLYMTAQQLRRRIDRDPARASAELRPQVDRLLDGAKRLEGLLRDFKEFAREQRLDLQPIALAPFLEDVVRGWQPEAESREVTLTLRGGDGLTIRLDRDKVHRVFDNLVKNALEAIDRGPGEIRIEVTTPTAQQVRVSVRDTGPGIPAGIDIFALFETTKPQGTGLGLPTCKQIVAAHGGGLAFATIQPHGVVFHVDLPIAGHAMFPASG